VISTVVETATAAPGGDCASKKGTPTGATNFYRIHKSHLINLNYLVKLTKTDLPSVIMTDGSEIEVSVRRKADFLRMMEE